MSLYGTTLLSLLYILQESVAKVVGRPVIYYNRIIILTFMRV